MENEELVECEYCKKSFPKKQLQKYCSNCFCCTGCERYLCPICDEVITVVAVRPMNIPKKE